MKTEKRNDQKLFKASGQFVKDFYFFATDETEAAQEAGRKLTFQIKECKVEETEKVVFFPHFWKQLFGR